MRIVRHDVRVDAAILKALVEALAENSRREVAAVNDERDVGPREFVEHAHEDLTHKALAVGEAGE